MKTNKIYVVEDMAMSRAALISMLTKNNFEVVGSAANADQAWDEMQSLEIELVLLDINLAGKKDGIWLAKMVRNYLKVAIVFLTAYGDDATLAKLAPLEPNGYLLKPYNKPTLITTINIALNTYRTLHLNKEIATDDAIIIESAGKKVKLLISKINYIHSDGNYIEIHLDDKVFIVREKLGDFFQNLPANDFMKQCHLRYIINKNKIMATTPNMITINDVEIPISKKFKNTINAF